MAYQHTIDQINDYRRQITELRTEMRELQATIAAERVEDYEFATPSGPLRLSALFGGHDTLILIHNMGSSCRYCTLWADGFNGLVAHLENRAAFVVVSPESPAAQEEFAASRGWRFRMVSQPDERFASDMGFFTDEGEFSGWQPGVSVFRRRDGEIVRVSHASLGPGDDFCALWHLFDLLPEGPADWQPQHDYN